MQPAHPCFDPAKGPVLGRSAAPAVAGAGLAWAAAFGASGEAGASAKVSISPSLSDLSR